MAAKLIIGFLILAAIGAVVGEGDTAATGAGETDSEVARDADCSGHNGNAAVAACHPDDPATQDACPDNDDPAPDAPTQACLDAVTRSIPGACPPGEVCESDPDTGENRPTNPSHWVGGEDDGHWEYEGGRWKYP